MDKQKQIEEMAKDVELAGKCTVFRNGKIDLTLFRTSEEIAETLYNLNYRKIPENAVVVPDMADKDFYAVEKSEWDKMVQGAKDIIHEREEKTRKETAEKFAERLKTDEDIKLILTNVRYMQTRIDEAEKAIMRKIDEICEEITEGKYDSVSNDMPVQGV